jgi:hypothetical protein
METIGQLHTRIAVAALLDPLASAGHIHTQATTTISISSLNGKIRKKMNIYIYSIPSLPQYSAYKI